MFCNARWKPFGYRHPSVAIKKTVLFRYAKHFTRTLKKQTSIHPSLFCVTPDENSMNRRERCGPISNDMTRTTRDDNNNNAISVYTAAATTVQTAALALWTFPYAVTTTVVVRLHYHARRDEGSNRHVCCTYYGVV